jgi:hypothetical protein
MSLRVRAFRFVTGERLQAVLTTEDPRGFSVPALVHRQQVADGYARPLADIVLDELDAIPDLTGAVAPPPSPVLPPTPEQAAVDYVLANKFPSDADIDARIDAIANLADVKTVLRRVCHLLRNLSVATRVDR